MARQRSLHPDFFSDPKILKLAPLERLFFQGLWCHADKRGVFVDDPEALSIRILPRDAGFEPEAAMARMACLGLVQRYRVASDERPLAQVVHFTRYQKPHPREAESGLPLPENTKRAELGQGSPEADLGSPQVGNYSRILRPSDPQAFGGGGGESAQPTLSAAPLPETPPPPPTETPPPEPQAAPPERLEPQPLAEVIPIRTALPAPTPALRANFRVMFQSYRLAQFPDWGPELHESSLQDDAMDEALLDAARVDTPNALEVLLVSARDWLAEPYAAKLTPPGKLSAFLSKAKSTGEPQWMRHLRKLGAPPAGSRREVQKLHGEPRVLANEF